MNLKVPDERINLNNPSLDEIERAVRKSFAPHGNATILVIDADKNIFIQSVGNHMEYNLFDDGPIYAHDNTDIDTAVSPYLSCARGEETWKTAIPWRLFLDVVDGQYQQV